MTKVVLQAIPHYMLLILPAPQGILQKIRTIHRNFLWSGNSRKQKWALADWDKLCRPKIFRGIGLQDPGTTNKASGAKLWWRWLTEPHTPWVKLWKARYAAHWQQEELVRITDVPMGSPIWNLARASRHIIQDHCFWEIRNGQSALFWEDAWQ